MPRAWTRMSDVGTSLTAYLSGMHHDAPRVSEGPLIKGARREGSRRRENPDDRAYNARVRAPSTLRCAWRDAKVRWGDPPTRDSTAAQGGAENATTTTPRCPPPRTNFTICTRRQVAYLCKSRGSEPRGSAELRCRLELYTKPVRMDGAERLYTFEG